MTVSRRPVRWLGAEAQERRERLRKELIKNAAIRAERLAYGRYLSALRRRSNEQIETAKVTWFEKVQTLRAINLA